ncbi:MAG: hypothetical protein RLY71_4153 [Pseudomonadota bacterium]|jgi:hydrogenase maturation protein HypF
MNPGARQATLPRAAPASVLAAGAWLKNAACRVDGAALRWSSLHGDLDRPEACAALDAALQDLAAAPGLQALAHDLHPDFASTHYAQALAQRLGLPALAVQHHHAHIAAVQAERGLDRPVIGLALDGVGLGTDGTAWGGELLWVEGARWRRLAHLPALALPGGDLAAREPWRMAAALLHRQGRADAIAPRFSAAVGAPLAQGVARMLDRGLHCPPSTSTGRWFDAVAGLLGLSLRQSAEAEAAITLERVATQWLETHGEPAALLHGSVSARPAMTAMSVATVIDLHPLAETLCDQAEAVHATFAHGDNQRAAYLQGEAAARFHLGLAQALAEATLAAAARWGCTDVALGGGCFHNRLLSQRLTQRLQGGGLRVHRGGECGDAALALGQAWVVAQALQQPELLDAALQRGGAVGLIAAPSIDTPSIATPSIPAREETPTCA